MKRPLRITLWLLMWLAFIGAGAIAFGYYVRPGMDEYAQHHYAAPPVPGTLTASWWGVTGVLLTDGQHSIFIDPFFTRRPDLMGVLRDEKIAPDEAAIGAWLERAGVSKLDAVLVSHSHYDHGMDAGVVAKMTGAKLLGSASTANIGRGAGLPEAQLQVAKSSEPIEVGSFKVTFVEGRHAGATGGAPTGDITEPLQPPAPISAYKQGGTYSILVEHAQGRVLHHGSAGFLPGALRLRKADVVFLGIALLPDLAEYLGETVDAVGATRVIPFHWDDFTRTLDEPLQPLPLIVRLDRFFDDMQKLRPAVAVQTLELGKPVALFPPPAP